MSIFYRLKYTGLFLIFVINICKVSSQDFNYAEVLQKSMWFYEVQRSGELPDNNRVEWRGSSAVNDGSDVGHDLSGGWYDAGDNMKFNFPMAASVTLLAWGGLEYPEGYQRVGQWGWLLNNIKWVTDYFVKCHTSPNEFYGQVGHGMTDHVWWGAPEVFPKERPSYKIDKSNPGSELAAEVAAALASSSILFRGTDPSYADNLLKHAKELFDFADKYRGMYHESITDATAFYKSWSGYYDELVWGALWLYCATGDSSYLSKAESLYEKLPKEPQSTTPKYKEALSWDDKTYGCYVLLAKITNKKQYHTDAQRWLDWWSYGYSANQLEGSWSSDSGIAYTPGGLSWIRQWGPLRYAANTAFAAFVYSDLSDISSKKKDNYYKWAKTQIDYALGSNENKRSYVCGFGVNPPTKPHHRSMHGPYLDDNGRTPVESRHVLYGALVGGPDIEGSHKDDRLDHVQNEVATDYNAGFSSALARLVKDNNMEALPDFPAPAVRDTEYTVIAKLNTRGDRFTEISATIQNKTTWPARYSKNLTIKYFVDLSEVAAAGYKVSDVYIDVKGCKNCISKTGNKLKQYGTDKLIYFTEISFEGELIYPGGQSAYRREVQFRIGLPNDAPQDIWDPTNDPSFTGISSMAGKSGNPNIPAYENGVIMWGKEPNGIQFVPQKWDKPDLSEPEYKPSGWDKSLFSETSPMTVKKFRSQIPPFALITTGNSLTISAAQDLKVGLYSLSGKKIYSEFIRKGSLRTISTHNFSVSILILKITGKGFKRYLKKQMI
ncbi:MAG: glycoside hydrolase family 9 protein [Chitinispirillia bacterium]|jgi:hypothetical protein